jgi:hypothetical protein
VRPWEVPVYLLCPCCGYYHFLNFSGDCGDDASKFTAEMLDRKHGVDGWEEVSDNW